MPRVLAAALFACAAFDWNLPWLDRAGVALLGLAALSFATPRGPRSAIGRVMPRPTPQEDLRSLLEQRARALEDDEDEISET